MLLYSCTFSESLNTPCHPFTILFQHRLAHEQNGHTSYGACNNILPLTFTCCYCLSSDWLRLICLEFWYTVCSHSLRVVCLVEVQLLAVNWLLHKVTSCCPLSLGMFNCLFYQLRIFHLLLATATAYLIDWWLTKYFDGTCSQLVGNCLLDQN